MLEKIISGGQRGADRAGVEAARDLGLASGGTAPRGWRVRLPDGSDGSDPDLAELGLVQHTSASYPARTRLNVENSDGTVWFGYAKAGGGKLTTGHCKKIGKPVIVNPSPDQLAAWVRDHAIRVLNVAGNRESSFNPEIHQQVYRSIVLAFGTPDQIAALGQSKVIAR
jgi:hypothetical protein